MEQKHLYGPRIHLIGNDFYNSILSKFCSPETNGLVLFQQLKVCYQALLDAAINDHYPKIEKNITTRMVEHSDKASFKTKVIDEKTKTVVVDIARAGIYPAQLCYELLNLLTDYKNIRQDHIYINRKTNEQGQVIGNTLTGSKIGGDVAGRILIFPDPMGATGGTLSYVVSHYQKEAQGLPLKVIALHLIITPEYIKRVSKDCPNMEVYALRLDRGLSTQKVLDSVPGTYPSEEVGLNEFQYIVPGAGGIGEVLNNSYV